MIESITIASEATFAEAPEALTGLSQFNYLFGSNGSGKTTISRVIADETSFPSCSVTWKAGTKIQPMVYNRDFVERNFNPSTELKGVFTLGEKQLDILAQIASAKREIYELTGRIETRTVALQGEDGNGGKKGELAELESRLKARCWAEKQKHDDTLQGGFKGYRDSADKFKKKVLEEQASNTAILLTLEHLKKKAESVFGPTPAKEESAPSLDTSKILDHEAASVLNKRVVGKEDVDISALITKLGNSDWVREGRVFYGLSEGPCPFCQQTTTDAFARSLDEYFDETFASDSKAVDDLATEYSTDASHVQQQLSLIIASPSKFLDVEKLKAEDELLAAKVTLNKQLIAGKQKEASRSVELVSLSNVCKAITKLIDGANSQVAAHNTMVENLAAERTTLVAQVWKFVLEELREDLAAFKSTKNGLDAAIASITTQLLTAQTEKTAKQNELRALEKLTTSVQPTIDDINALLSSFGFQGFKLDRAASGTSYKMVRLDGTDAKATLSEGEKSFVTFLYFYHLLKGSESESGVTNDRIAVFDDPVSSLDSDILFIVSSLIKGLCGEVRAGTGQIKQIFVLTHNVYFHKEVTYNGNRKRNEAMNEETFWIVRKLGLVSKLKKYEANPVTTSYEMLWAEVRNPDRSKLTIQNTMRRILENYFKILGGINLHQLCTKFDGKEKLICNSLCSWVHDGSHYAHDDIFVSIDDAMVNSYLKVFKAIFDKWDHSPHYEMMMGDTSDVNPALIAGTSAVSAPMISPTV